MMRSDSRRERCAATGLEVLVGPAAGSLQTPSQIVSLDLLVPLIRQEFLEPLREAIVFFGGELGNSGLNLLDALVSGLPNCICRG
jgi:hypothetical protein